MVYDFEFTNIRYKKCIYYWLNDKYFLKLQDNGLNYLPSTKLLYCNMMKQSIIFSVCYIYYLLTIAEFVQKVTILA